MSSLSEALLDLQFANVMFYSVDMTRFVSLLTAKPDPGRQNNLCPQEQMKGCGGRRRQH